MDFVRRLRQHRLRRRFRFHLVQRSRPLKPRLRLVPGQSRRPELHLPFLSPRPLSLPHPQRLQLRFPDRPRPRKPSARSRVFSPCDRQSAQRAHGSLCRRPHLPPLRRQFRAHRCKTRHLPRKRPVRAPSQLRRAAAFRFRRVPPLSRARCQRVRVCRPPAHGSPCLLQLRHDRA